MVALSSLHQWRYRCPDCGSASVEKLVGGERQQNVSFSQGYHGQVHAEETRALKYRCRKCNDRKKAVRDAKTGELASP